MRDCVTLTYDCEGQPRAGDWLISVSSDGRRLNSAYLIDRVRVVRRRNHQQRRWVLVCWRMRLQDWLDAPWRSRNRWWPLFWYPRRRRAPLLVFPAPE